MMHLRKVVNIALVLALGVLMLGAYTRLTDAGLGCPDWPGCYGHIVLPSAHQRLEQAQALYPDQAIEKAKAWTEMLHRYFAGSLLILITFVLITVLKSTTFRVRIGLGPVLLLVLLMGFQAALGMWTVTLKLLPPVVMGHLLGGMLIFSLLAFIRARLVDIEFPLYRNWRPWLFLGVILIFVQLALGGWVSANYAAISCQGFPGCNGLWVPPLDFKHAFDLLQSIGPNYQGGLLEVDARMTIQWVHRVFAFLVYLFWVVLAARILNTESVKSIRSAAWSLLVLFNLQMFLGIFNVTHDMPLITAVLHNGIAALILGLAFVLNGLARGSLSKNA
jgi:cytochrome c oxidase assembly protein subunit 15